MFLIKLPIKIILLPVVLLLTLFEWIGIFLTSISSILTNLLSGVFFLTALLSYAFGQSTGHETLVIMATAFVIFILPYIAAWAIARLIILKEIIKAFIWS